MNQHFTLNNGIIVSDAYARKRIIARLRRYRVIPLKDRQAIADYMVYGTRKYAGYLVSALERSAFDLWIGGDYE